MKVLLLNPHPGRPEIPVYPLGLAYIAAALTDHEPRGCDLQLEDDPERVLDSVLKDFQPDVIGIAIRNVDSSASYDGFSYFPAVRACVRQIREAVPDVRLIAGGSGFSLFPEAIMRRLPELDYGVRFEAERAFSALLANLDRPGLVEGVCFRDNGAIQVSERGAMIDFATLSEPDRTLFGVGKYVARGARIGVQTNRGCAFRCVYCTYPFLDGPAVRSRSAGAVVDEFESLIGGGANEFFLCDSVFNVPRGHAEGICSEILRRGLEVRFFAFFNESFTSREQLELARDAGCDLAVFGSDAGHPTTLHSYRKRHTLAQLEQSYRWCRELGLPYKCAFLMNGPGETLVSFTHLVFFVLRLWISARLSFSLSTMRIYPHTEAHRLAIEGGLIDADDDLVEARYYNPSPLRLPCAVISALGRVLRVTLERRRAKVSS